MSRLAIQDKNVVAIVTTYNAEDSLRRVVRALASQTSPVRRIVVANNGNPIASSFCSRYPRLELQILNLDENLGPAGGFHRGIQEAMSGECDYVWLFCDDIFPEPGCLHNLLSAVDAQTAPVIALGTVVESRGVFRYPAWTGALLPRKVVDLLGMPLANLFWWGEDTEYLLDRPLRIGIPVTYPDHAVVFHAEERRTNSWPVWKYYYVSRNTLFLRLHYRENATDWRAVRRIARAYTGMLGRMLVHDNAFLGPASRALLRGTLDGLRGDIGSRPYIGSRNSASDAARGLP